jgi:hypothetical protein
MGWKCSNYHLFRLTEVFIRYLRVPLLNLTGPNPRKRATRSPTPPRPSRRLPARLAMVRRPITPVHGRLLTFCRDHGRTPTTPRPCSVRTRPPRTRTTPRKAIRSLYKFVSTLACTSTLEPLPSEPLLRKYTPLLPSPGPYYITLLHGTPAGYLPVNSPYSPEKRSTSTWPPRRLASTSANYTTSSQLDHDGEDG